MSEEIKEILENVRKCCEITKDQSFVVYQRTDILKLLDYTQQTENIIKELKKVNYYLSEDLIKAMNIINNEILKGE